METLTTYNLMSEKKFSEVCASLVAVLEAEYQTIKDANFEALHAINLKKSELQEQFQGVLMNYTAPGVKMPETVSLMIDQVHKASVRNANILAGAIDGAASVVRELRRITNAEVYTGLYNADGELRHTDAGDTTLGKA